MKKTSTAPLGKLARIDRGISWASAQETREPGLASIPVLRIGNVQQRLDLADLLYINGVSDKQRRKNTASRGSVIMVGSNGNHDRIGNCCRINDDANYMFASFLVGLLPERDEVDPAYLFHVLRSPIVQDAISASVTGSTGLANLSLSFLKALEVFHPDKLEQERIAGFLDLVDRAIEQTEALLAKQQRIKAGLMHDLLTRGLDTQGRLRDPVTHKFKRSPLGKIPEEWDVAPLESLVPKNAPICYGIVQVGPDTPGGVPTIAIRDLGNIEVSLLHHTERGRESKFVRSRVESGDLLLSVKATTGEVGVVPPGFLGNISRDLARIRLQPSENPPFFKYQMQSDAGQRRLAEIIVGTTRREISIIPLRSLLIARPKPSEQEAIAERIQSTEKDIAALNAELEKLRRQKTGLMQDLLTGRVPATPLLATKPN